MKVQVASKSARHEHCARHAHIHMHLNSLILPLARSNRCSPLLPAVAFLVVVVLLLITCAALLVLALAVTTTKLKRLRAEKGHTDPPHYYNQTGQGEETENGIYDEVRERTGYIVKD